MPFIFSLTQLLNKISRLANLKSNFQTIEYSDTESLFLAFEINLKEVFLNNALRLPNLKVKLIFLMMNLFAKDV